MAKAPIIPNDAQGDPPAGEAKRQWQPTGKRKFKPAAIVAARAFQWPTRRSDQYVYRDVWFYIAAQIARTASHVRILLALRQLVDLRSGTTSAGNDDLADWAGGLSVSAASKVASEFGKLGLLIVEIGWRVDSEGKTRKARTIRLAVPDPFPAEISIDPGPDQVRARVLLDLRNGDAKVADSTGTRGESETADSSGTRAPYSAHVCSYLLNKNGAADFAKPVDLSSDGAGPAMSQGERPPAFPPLGAAPLTEPTASTANSYASSDVGGRSEARQGASDSNDMDFDETNYEPWSGVIEEMPAGRREEMAASSEALHNSCHSAEDLGNPGIDYTTDDDGDDAELPTDHPAKPAVRKF